MKKYYPLTFALVQTLFDSDLFPGAFDIHSRSYTMLQIRKVLLLIESAKSIESVSRENETKTQNVFSCETCSLLERTTLVL